MKWYYFLAVVYFLGQGYFAYGQNDSEFDLLDSDRIFLLAQRLEQKSERKKSRAMCYMALNKNPSNQDIRLFLAESYLKDELYDFARQELEQVIVANPEKLESYILGAAIESQLGNFDKAIEYCDKGLKQENTSEQLLLVKAQSQAELAQNKEAAKTLATLLHVNPNHEVAMVMYQQLTHIEYIKHLSVAYHYNRFNHFYDDAHFLTLEGMQNTQVGRIVEKLSISQRGEEMGWQAMLDLYPNIFKHTYGMVRIGVGSRNIFPNFLLGTEIFQDIHQIQMDASVGLRYHRFDTSAYTSFTASVAKRFNKFGIGGRTYLTPLISSFNWRVNVHAAMHFQDDHFIRLEYGYGADPDDMVDTARDFLLVDSQRIGLIYQIPLPFSQNLLAKATAKLAMANNLPEPNSSINRLDIGLKLIFRFHKIEGIFPQKYTELKI